MSLRDLDARMVTTGPDVPIVRAQARNMDVRSA